MTRVVTDQAARDRIRTDLGTTLLVEAGAGSGKTTSLVARMIEHVRTGTPVERIAAVTFTRKAANELRERFQLALEQAAAEGGPGREACTRALHELDRAFIGTIHAFCGRLLRERPLEVGLDPAFQELSDAPWIELKQRFWRRWVERTRLAGDADLRELATLGVEPWQLADGFELVMTYPDVEFAAPPVPAPDVAAARRRLNGLMREARAMMPREEPEGGWDRLMQLVRRLELRRGVDQGWPDAASFCAVLEGITASHCAVVQRKWSADREGKAAARALGEAFLAFAEGEAADTLRQWREHRYPVVLRYLRRAADAFARERHVTGLLGFEDLLLLTARLLRENPNVRRALGERYPYLLVDEFQDTDPIQAEVCFLLASDPAEGHDWRAVRPRPGSLFVVGDPKQSIYRFRRADIQVYDFVKQRIAAFGDVLALTSNFRSVRSIGDAVNAHFAAVLPPAATAEQAAFAPVEADAEPAAGDGVFRYVVRPEARRNDALLTLDAALVGSWIAERIARDGRRPADFLVLTPGKKTIERYARALGERNIPVATTGARLPREHELNELLVVLRALADPTSGIAVAAALEGLFFGLSPADLWEGARAGVRLTLTHPPAEGGGAVGAALARLHGWWRVSQRHPADVLLERILDDTGLLVHAASEPLGDARGGALIHLVEALRAASVLGAGGITDAMAHLEALLAAEAADAPLRPGRTDAVRVMNLHKAKGLEAEVVILAAPTDDREWEARAHVRRTEAGLPTGGLCIGYGEGRSFTVLAHPAGWAEMQAAEAAFAAAEDARLLYVAATRARRELVVSQAELPLAREPRPDASIWRPLAPVLEAHGTVLALREVPPPGRKALERTADSIGAAGEDAARRREAAATRSVRSRTVTEAAKADGPAASGGGGVGAAWGRAVHRVVEALARGREGAALEALVRAIAREEALPEAQAAELASVPARVRGSDGWRWLTECGEIRAECGIMRRSDEAGVAVLTEGVIDAVALGPDGWRIVDWKTDRVDDDVWAERARTYERQVAAYAAMLSELTGRPATARIQRI